VILLPLLHHSDIMLPSTSTSPSSIFTNSTQLHQRPLVTITTTSSAPPIKTKPRQRPAKTLQCFDLDQPPAPPQAASAPIFGSSSRPVCSETRPAVRPHPKEGEHLIVAVSPRTDACKRRRHHQP
jgi:hypothetical protein